MTADPDRAATRLAWTRATLDEPALTLQPASADASFRSYWRTRAGDTSWIVMDSPPAQEDPAPWLAIGGRLRAAGLHVPAVRAYDLEQGFLLIEDLGSRPYLPALNDASADTLYGQAMDALLRMQRDVDSSTLPPYDDTFLQRELALMPEWFLQRHLGCTPDEQQRDVIDAAFAVLLRNAAEQPRVFVHRDFHSRNLMLVDPPAAAGNADAATSPATDRTAQLPCAMPFLDASLSGAGGGRWLASPGIIDFQGALHGPLAYDLASLLRDCYIAWDEARVQGWVEFYRQRALEAGLIDAGVGRERFCRWFDLIGLQRHLKVLGIFCRLWYRDGKRGYLDDLPRVFGYVLQVARRYPELAALAALLERRVGTRDLTVAASA